MRTLKNVKRYEELGHCHWTALATKLGGIENVIDIIMGRKEVSIIDRQPLLFDKRGRVVPSDNIEGKIIEPDNDYVLSEPTINYEEVIENIKLLVNDSGLMNASDFEGQINSLWNKIKSEPSLKNVNKAICLPMLIPHIPNINIKNYFNIIGNEFLPMVGKIFGIDNEILVTDSGKNSVSVNNLSIVKGVRYEELLSLIAKGPVVGLFLPDSLRGFPVESQRQQIQEMPNNMFLAGALEYLMAVALYKPTFTRDYDVPNFDLSVIQSLGENVFLKLKPKTFSLISEKNSSVGCNTSSGGILII